MRVLVDQLKHRGVFRAAAYYAAGAWLVVQVATAVFPFLEFPNWSVRLIIVSVIAGFPVALLVSWFYRWTPGGLEREIEPADHARVVAPAAPARENAIAVLPFADLSPQKDQEYFADGLAEELLGLLAQLPQLQVIARSSSFSFKGRNLDVRTIAGKLGVASVLEGSVRKSGNRLRVTAQLIRAADDAQLWSQTYERELTDVFEVQDQIANAVVAALKIKLLPSQHVTNVHRTGNTEAYDQFLLGQNVIRRGRYDDYRRALAAFQRAVALDPDYGAAWAALALAQSSVADFAATNPGERSAAKLEALATADKAIAVAPELADGYAIRAHLRRNQLWDWTGAVQDLERALALEPNKTDTLQPYGLMLIILMRYDEAIVASRTAIASDPLSWLSWMMLGATLWRAGQVQEAREAFEHALDISPDSSFTRYEFGCLELEQGRTGQALEHFHKAGAAFSEAGIAMAEHTLEHERESQAALAELESKYAVGFSYQIVQAHAWRGERNAAFEWLERAYAQRDAGVTRMRGDPMLAPLRDDPRYVAFVRKLNFPDSAR
ncbi:MAG TPA: tetratricopeptide repeat protein [Rudaea sp.]|nr:tetratricopeptide repeat protein [Rudaea sp.]